MDNGNNIKLMESSWILVSRFIRITCKRHVNKLRHNGKVNHEITENSKETGQNV